MTYNTGVLEEKVCLSPPLTETSKLNVLSLRYKLNINVSAFPFV